MQFIDGGVTAPEGFTANGMLCGIKAGRTKNDTALIYSEKPCTAAGVFTQNRVKAESVKLTKKHLENGKAQAVIANSGNANACTGAQGAENALRMAKAAAGVLGISPEDVVVCSTGVIGQQLPVEVIEKNIQTLKDGLSKKGHAEARTAIMTTDTHYKECAVETEIGGKKVRIGAMCKGSGMIHINLGTMLSFMTTDCAISSAMLEKALRMSIEGTYNCVSVDGDTSTNDTLTILANGMAGNAEIVSEGKDFDAFYEALNAINTQMAKKIAGDGEGATRLIECNVSGACDVPTARRLAKSVISSSLVKAAFFGKDANWGRILCAMGYSGEQFTPETTTVAFESAEGAQRTGFTDFVGEQTGKKTSITVFENGVPLNFDEDLAKKILSEDEVVINVTLKDGNACGTAWGCDLTYDYVKINGDYRT
ncbi:bifunctional glutamate N-acetyltransferase/amino-acid acetyltransferase ArgJ [Treponema rectale]|uniref:Arginine biosynthesis bifunctional protein ArgJ n=1 Tax=Treponema rectale TaxID=744512 RepID=A0A840SEZ6_9SPIR|nr:bifunctional glutamate N-acetyltransferase/amino-acid acetyltransferase ArgJ [Treponema rectale]MBB5218022.1 glutamate N-acetyltransferase/amino-acid N-acetyltransferase [Treponema rectale]QOS40263.1 bifunctional glutamate N-acetyltransferase/amino-acid acetyltransferase ArgJ [Treponema rectale]